MNGRLIFLILGLVAAAQSLADEFEFVVIGDTRPRFESEDFRQFESLIPKINALKPAFVINLGDLIYGYGPLSKEKQWDKYERVITAIEPPYYQAPGNHDTHSKEARRIYMRRFGKCYQSFDYGGCHFVLLDNTEAQRGGNIGPAEFAWLQEDLKRANGQPTFMFFHFPVWEPERVAPKYYEFWARSLHPLFKASGVRAVFAGHYHTYGPSREFDGIRYFITGGGGAELIPDYKKSGGEHHFVVVKVNRNQWDLRIVTERGELTDAEADVMGGLQFGDQNSSRIGFEAGAEDLKTGTEFSVSLRNPYADFLTGKASWVYDASSFKVEPHGATVEIAPGATQVFRFTLQALKDAATLQSLPRLEFNVMAGGRRRRFHRELLMVQKAATPYQRLAPTLDGQLGDWEGIPALTLSNRSNAQAQLRTLHTDDTLYLAVTIPTVKEVEEDESAVIDALQIGIARRLDGASFSGDFLRLGFTPGMHGARNASPGHDGESLVPGVKSASAVERDRTNYEIAIPLRLLRHVKAGPEGGLVLNCSFRAPDAAGAEPLQPQPNTFAYRVRYGGDALLPVYFVELSLEKKRRAANGF
jgi:hypothetical protein